jgi:hypothetical protein
MIELFFFQTSSPAVGAVTVNISSLGGLVSSPRAASADTRWGPFHDSPSTAISPENSSPPSSTAASSTASPPSTVIHTISAFSATTDTATGPAEGTTFGMTVMPVITGSSSPVVPLVVSVDPASELRTAPVSPSMPVVVPEPSPERGSLVGIIVVPSGNEPPSLAFSPTHPGSPSNQHGGKGVFW